MQSIILAAGMGKRLGQHTQEDTKCMIEVNSKKLIQSMLDALYNVGVTKSIVVVGFGKNNLIRFIEENYSHMDIDFIVNEKYYKTNNIYSLYLARHHLSKDNTLLLESDLIFEEKILKRLIEDSREDLAVVDKFSSWMDGTAVKLDEYDTITTFISKRAFNFSESEEYFKTVNIYKFSQHFSEKIYIPFLEAYCSALGHNEYYEQVLRVITTLENCNLKGFRLDKEKWYEIDDIQDLDNAETIFSATPADRLKRLQHRYGGYWRYPALKDFCYLVNPYFPVKRMEQELKANMAELLRDYPSGQRIQNLLAAKMFQVDKNQILVGNGASELILGLSNAVEGKFGIVFPTFDEYAERIGHDRVIQFIPKNDQFRYSIGDLLDLTKTCDNLLLINPDNPSGHYLPKAHILELLKEMEGKKKKIIIDESFVDFCNNGPDDSIINLELLSNYPNLIVIKSISKSYGVPGLRLGVVASADHSLLEKINQNLPIWNINSFAEFFLQIIGKYSKEYREGCAYIVNERHQFYSELQTIPWLKVFPSEANYFLCRINGDLSATELAQIMIDEHDMLIKDLSLKKGFSDKKYVRIAVRDRTDNEALVEALRSISNLKPAS